MVSAGDEEVSQYSPYVPLLQRRLLLIAGAFTSPVAFIVSGEMASAYFIGHFPRSGNILPITNGGDPAVLLSFIFLYLSAAGGGAWSVDKMMGRDKK